jgi:uncharacterized protein YndB with AHSA1/START domain
MSMATRSVSIEPVVKTVTLSCTPEEAFRYFTADFGVWWPAATHSVVAYASQFKAEPSTVILEPRLSGRIFERTDGGEDHAWGSVLVWQPPTRLAFSFHPGRDAQEAQTVEVTFSPAPDGTQVVLMHSGWEKLHANPQEARDSYNAGWQGVFVTVHADYVGTRRALHSR